jgi:hypothetical protein
MEMRSKNLQSILEEVVDGFLVLYNYTAAFEMEPESRAKVDRAAKLAKWLQQVLGDYVFTKRFRTIKELKEEANHIRNKGK